MMPVTMATPGDVVTIKKIRLHLAELGFVVDTTVSVITQLGGNVILQVRDSRVALDRSMANRIYVVEGDEVA